jgi:hypothetical protein
MSRILHSSRMLVASLVAGVLLTTAGADDGRAATPPIVTNQAHAARAGFLAYAPPPAGAVKALCLVDSGVNATPDTMPGLVLASALDGGTGADVDPLIHGTNDAVIAGGAGYTHIGAWPQLKIVSIRATDIPQPGKQPTFQFDDYIRGITRCTLTQVPGVEIGVIVLPLASVIPPTPGQIAEFAGAVAATQTRGISILAAAGNTPGAIQLPGSQRGILPVGAGDPDNGVCSFSATIGLTFYAPGCGIHQLDAQGRSICCGNGTSQASVFAAAVLVALRSYAPTLSAQDGVQLLVRTAKHGHLDVTGVFEAAGLAEIVKAGRAAIPKRPGRPSVRRVTWRGGVLDITLRRMPKGANLHVKMTFAKSQARRLTTTTLRVRVGTPPKRVTLRYTVQTATRTLTGPSIARTVSWSRGRR